MTREEWYLSRRHQTYRWWWEGAIDDLLAIYDWTKKEVTDG